MQALFIALVIAVVAFFLTSGFMYRYIMPILINRWLLNLIFSMTKALSRQSSSKQNFQLPSSPLFNAIWKALLQILLVLLFSPSLFHFKFYKFFLAPFQLLLHILGAKQI